jgi:hypothetical protein
VRRAPCAVRRLNTAYGTHMVDLGVLNPNTVKTREIAKLPHRAMTEFQYTSLRPQGVNFAEQH